MSNPYTYKLQKAQANLSRLEAEQDILNKNAIPGTFVTGRSGVSRSYSRRLDRQLDRTIDLAKAVTEARRNVRRLALQEKLYEQGKINSQGRSITPKPARKSRPQSEKAKIIKKAILTLSLDGECILPTGHTLEVLAYWDEVEKEITGIIRVVDGDTIVDHRTKSIQGVHLKEMQAEVINNILATSPTYC